VIVNNRSLRNIKNELESLLEHNAITDEQYDTIMGALPAEMPLNNATLSIPRSNVASAPRAPSPAAPAAALAHLSVNDNHTPPPSYMAPSGPPTQQASQTPEKPEIARATALYRYTEPQDCDFEVGDHIAVYEYMNAEWWLGKNLRTGKEGVFPRNYVQVQPKTGTIGYDGAASPQGSFGSYEKGNYGVYPGQPQYQVQQATAPSPGPSNPYNSDAPPMAVAEQRVDGRTGKAQEMGKKFGKKLGNAAIFGAGATIGSDLVNSIF